MGKKINTCHTPYYSVVSSMDSETGAPHVAQKRKQKIPQQHPELERVLRIREAPVPNVPYADTPFRLQRLIATILRRAGRALTLAEVCTLATVMRMEPHWLEILQSDVTEIALYTALRTMQAQKHVCVTTETVPVYRMLFSLARP